VMLLPLPVFHGESVRVWGGNERWSKRLPLTLTLSPLKSGERGQVRRIYKAGWWS